MSSALPSGPPLAPPPAPTAAAVLTQWFGLPGRVGPRGLAALALLLVTLAGLLLAWGMRSTRPASAAAQALALAEASAPDAAPPGTPAPAPRRTDVPLAEPEPSTLAAASSPVSMAAPPTAPSLAPAAVVPGGSGVAPLPAATGAQQVGLLQAAAEDIKTLLDHQQRQAERIEQLGQQIAGLAATLDRLQARPAARPVAAKRVARRVAAPAVTAASTPAPPAQATLLSVDLWDGRPSVVIGTDSAEDRRVRFLSEGDRQSGVALKQASPVEQRAVFDVAGREVVLDREGRR